MWLLKIGALLGALQVHISRIFITHDHKSPGQWGCVGVGGVCLGQMTRKGSEVRVLYALRFGSRLRVALQPVLVAYACSLCARSGNPQKFELSRDRQSMKWVLSRTFSVVGTDVEPLASRFVIFGSFGRLWAVSLDANSDPA
jgi:hypothetical protein